MKKYISIPAKTLLLTDLLISLIIPHLSMGNVTGESIQRMSQSTPPDTTGITSCTKMNNRTKFNGPLRYNEKNPRYFTDANGNAVYLTGSHTWAVMQDMWLENEPRKNMDYEGFIQMMEENNHNFLRFWQYGHIKNAKWNDISTVFDPLPYARTGPGTARDGLLKFDLTQWNEAYFERLRERVEIAASKGIYVSIMFFEAWVFRFTTKPETDPWPYHPLHPDNNINEITDNPVIGDGRAMDFFTLKCPQLVYQQKEFIKKVIDTVNDLDNVLFEICNELRSTKEALEWQNHLCQFIKEYEKNKPKQHPVGITPQGTNEDNSKMFETSADWISIGYGKAMEYRYNPPAADGTKVIISDTDHLWGFGGEVSWVWKSFTRGMNVIFMDPWEPLPADMEIQQGWVDKGVSMNSRYFYKWDPIRRNLGYTRRFALRMDLNNCLPFNELFSSTFCLANPGNEYLCYMPGGGDEGLDLSSVEGEYAVEWFSPDTGMTVKGENIKGGKHVLMTSPLNGQTVVYIYRINN